MGNGGYCLGKSFLLVLLVCTNLWAATFTETSSRALILYPGFPPEIEVVIRKNNFAVKEQDSDPHTPLELVQLTGAASVLHFQRDPDSSRVSLQLQMDEAEYFDLGKFPLETLREVFRRFSKPGDEVSVQVSPDLWAPGRVQTLAVDVTDDYNPKLQLWVETYQVAVGAKADWIEPDIRIEEIAIEDVGTKVLPLASSFRQLPANAGDQNFFVQRDFEAPVPVVVLGFADKDKANIAYSGSRYAYVVSRQALEERHENIEIYTVPGVMLRYTYQAEAERLRREARKQRFPAWMEYYNLHSVTAYSPKSRSFQAAVDYHRELAERHLRANFRPPLQDVQKCSLIVAAKRGRKQ